MHFLLHWGQQCTAPNELPNAGPGDTPKGALPSLGVGVYAFSVSFLFAVCAKMRYMDTRAMAMQCKASLYGWNAGPGDTP